MIIAIYNIFLSKNIFPPCRDHGFEHYTVNHSKTFVHPTTGAHTNTIEGLWKHAKDSLPRHNRAKKNFLGYLATFMLRRKFADKEDGFASFMELVSKQFNGDDSNNIIK